MKVLIYPKPTRKNQPLPNGEWFDAKTVFFHNGYLMVYMENDDFDTFSKWMPGKYIIDAKRTINGIGRETKFKMNPKLLGICSAY